MCLLNLVFQLSYTTLRSTRLKRITLGGKNYKMYEYGNVTHLVSNAVLQENTTLVCHYFGCFKDDDYFYPFDAVSCTFGEEGELKYNKQAAILSMCTQDS